MWRTLRLNLSSKYAFVIGIACQYVCPSNEFPLLTFRNTVSITNTSTSHITSISPFTIGERLAIVVTVPQSVCVCVCVRAVPWRPWPSRPRGSADSHLSFIHCAICEAGDLSGAASCQESHNSSPFMGEPSLYTFYSFHSPKLCVHSETQRDGIPYST